MEAQSQRQDSLKMLRIQAKRG